MSLADLKKEMLRCIRCSECKWVPQAAVGSVRFARACPSISRYNFHAYAAGGRNTMGMSILIGRMGYTNDYLDILYRCNMCGACDVSCKCNKDMEPFAVNQELKIKAVEDGQLLPQHMPVIDGLRKEDNMMQARKTDRGNWAKGLGLKNITEDKASVYFHAGCRYSFDEELWPVIQSAANLLKKTGLDFAIAGKDENCCGGRAYEMGYLGETTKYAENNLEMLKNAGVKTIVTACSDCYYAFKVLYPKIMGSKGSSLQVMHITEYLDKLIKEGKLKLSKKVPMVVTYHDPCHLGRMGEPYIPWQGVEKKVFSQSYIYDPPKPWRKGTHGIYQPPRDIIQSIPGITMIEMERRKEYAWCCGAGGDVIDAYPDFANWTAMERIEEAKTTGAETIVTACPWCKRNFTNALKENGERMKVMDIIEMVEQAI
jgi:Fe-S oxidoreductase